MQEKSRWNLGKRKKKTNQLLNIYKQAYIVTGITETQWDNFLNGILRLPVKIPKQGNSTKGKYIVFGKKMGGIFNTYQNTQILNYLGSYYVNIYI